MPASRPRRRSALRGRCLCEAPVRRWPPGDRHAFCRQCGSPLPIVDRTSAVAAIPAGLLEGDPGVRPVRHVSTRRTAPWHAITDALPRHATHAPRAQRPATSLLHAVPSARR